MKKRLTKFIAYILIISLFLQPVSLLPVSASSNIENIASNLTAEFESTIEAMEDSISVPVSAGNWWYATQKDYIKWNDFHNAVQEEIIAKYGDEMKRELRVNYKDEEGNLTGKYGKVDLYMEEKKQRR